MFAAFFAACGDAQDNANADPYDVLANDSLGVMEGIATSLAGVTDAASAEAAKGKIADIGKSMEAIKARMEALGEPDEAREKELEAKYKDRFEAAQKAMMGHMQRIMSNPEIAGALGEAMKVLGDL